MAGTLYHGGPREIEGALLPFQGKDISGNKDNQHRAIYATSRRGLAVIMGILRCPEVGGSSLDFTTGEAIIYKGWPDRERIFLYHLPPETFEETPSVPFQYISKVPVIPNKIEEIQISGFLHLIKKASKEETQTWSLNHHIY